MKAPVANSKGERGQATLLVILALSIFLLGALGLAIDASQLYAQQQMAQVAADAAAMSGALSIFHGTNSTSGNPFATGSPPSPFTCTATDGRTPCAYARLNGFGGSSSDAVSVSFPTSVPGVTLASGTAVVISVNVRRTVDTTLLRIFGRATATAAANAMAALVKTPLANCITVLDPSAKQALSLNGNTSLNIPTCGIAVDSASNDAFDANGNVSVVANSIQVVGNTQQNGNVSLSPSPTNNAPATSDPFASVPAPSFTGCDYTPPSKYTGNHQGKNALTFNPGTYCGSLVFNGNIDAIFNPGTYVLLGGLSTNGNVSLTGSGVTLYNSSNASYPYAPISLTGNITVSLTATASGALTGILFFGDRNSPAGSKDSFVGNSSVAMTGALYFPNDELDYVGNASGTGSTQNVALVARTVSLNGNASLKIDPTQAGAAQQIKVALVQ